MTIPLLSTRRWRSIVGHFQTTRMPGKPKGLDLGDIPSIHNFDDFCQVPKYFVRIFRGSMIIEHRDFIKNYEVRVSRIPFIFIKVDIEFPFFI